jgi:hypothetical protein
MRAERTFLTGVVALGLTAAAGFFAAAALTGDAAAALIGGTIRRSRPRP